MLPKLAVTVIASLMIASQAGAQSAKPLATTTFISGSGPENVRPLVGAGVYRSTSELGYYLNGGFSVFEGATAGSASSGGTSTVTDQTGTGYFLNIGASMPVGSVLTFYGGIGLAGVSGQGADSGTRALTLDTGGSYQAETDALGANYNAGVLVSAGSVVFEAGYNTYFETSYVGIGFGF